MSDLNVKVGLIGKLDMLKFKNMSKVREKAIQAAPAKEVSGVFPINENAEALHPRRWADVEYGYIHPCSSFPTSDLVLEAPGEFF